MNKRFNRILSIGAMAAVMVGAVVSSGCTSGPDSADMLTIDATILGTDGTPLSAPSSTAIFHIGVLTDGEADNTDSLPGMSSHAFDVVAGRVQKTVNVYGRFEFNNNNITVNCVADITDGASGTTYTGVGATSCSKSFVTAADGNKVFVVTGTWRLISATPTNPTNPGSTGSGGGPSAMNELFRRNRSNPASTYDRRNGYRPDGVGHDDGAYSSSGSAAI